MNYNKIEIIEKPYFTNSFSNLTKIFLFLATAPAWQFVQIHSNNTGFIGIDNNSTQKVVVEHSKNIKEGTIEKTYGTKVKYYIPQHTPKRDIQKQIVDASNNNPHYYLLLATIESHLNEKAKAHKGGGRGLYQFVPQTWLEKVRNYGDKYGLEKEALMIKKGKKNNPNWLFLSNSEDKNRILNMRYDPTISTQMVIEFTEENKYILQHRLREKITPENLYVMHFLGRGDGVIFFKHLRQNPNWNPVDYFSDMAIKRNKSIFYARDGETPRTFAQVHNHFKHKIRMAERFINPPIPKPSQKPKITTASRQVKPPTFFKL